MKPINQLLIKVWSPGNKKCRKTRCNAPKGTHYTMPGIEQALAAVGKQIRRTWPEERYEMVMINAGQYNFVWRGKIEQQKDEAPVSRILDEHGRTQECSH